MLDQVGLEQRVAVEPVAVLRRDEYPLDFHRPLAAVLVELVADGDLGLAVGPQVREDVRLPHLGEPPRQAMGEHDRQRHQLVGLVRGVAEHHPLVARSLTIQRVAVPVLLLVRMVDALGDVGRLLVDRNDDAAGLGVEAELRARVADLADLAAHELRDVDVRLGGDLAGDDDEPGRDQRLAGDAPWGSSARTASSTESEIWSAILSGWPSVTDSEVKENERFGMAVRLDVSSGLPGRWQPTATRRLYAIARSLFRGTLHSRRLGAAAGP